MFLLHARVYKANTFPTDKQTTNPKENVAGIKVISIHYRPMPQSHVDNLCTSSLCISFELFVVCWFTSWYRKYENFWQWDMAPSIMWKYAIKQKQTTTNVGWKCRQFFCQKICKQSTYKPGQKHSPVLWIDLRSQHWCRVWVQARMRQLVHTAHVSYRETHRDFHMRQCQERYLLCHVHKSTVSLCELYLPLQWKH